jgi:molybdopterin synthase sulfur carrier subunit
MMLTIKYFGAVADVTQKQEEQFQFENGNSLEGIQSELKARYPDLQKIPYSFAINRSLANENATLKDNDELALLPPFAGG